MGHVASASGRAADGTLHFEAATRRLGPSALGGGVAAQALTSGLEEAAVSGTRSGANLLESFSGIGKAASKAGSALMVSGLAGGIGAIVAGAAAAAAGATGLGGAVGLIAKSGPAMTEVRRAVAGFGREFGDLKGQTAAFLPEMRGLEQAAVGVGGALAQVGIKNMGASLSAGASVANTLKDTIAGIEPAVAPSLRAAASLVDAAGDAFVGATPAIAGFANTVDAAAPALGQLTQGLVESAAVAGGATVQGLAAIAPLVTPETVLGGVGAVSGALGGAGVGALIGSIVPGLGTAVGAAIGGIAGGVAGGVGGAGVAHFYQPSAGGDQVTTETGGRMTAGAPAGYNPLLDPGYAAKVGAPGPSPADTGGPTSRVGREGGVIGPSGRPTGPSAADQLGAAGARSVGGTGAGLGLQGGALQQLAGQYNTASAAANQYGTAASNSFNQAGAASQAGGGQVQRGVQGAAQSVQQAQAQVAPAAHALGAQIPQQMSQGVQATQAAPAAPVHQAVRTAVQDAAPTAESGGASLGGAMTGGMSEGVTKTETSVLTIIKKWITRVIDAGAEALDAQSPSRKFAELGASIPQGLAVGVTGSQGLAVTATQQAIGRVVQGATGQLGGAARGQLAQAGGELHSALTDQLAGITPPEPRGTGPFAGLTDSRGVGGRYDQRGLAERQQQQAQQAQRAQEQSAAEAHASRLADTQKTIARLGYTPETQRRAAERITAHDEQARLLREGDPTQGVVGIQQRHEAAVYRSLHGMPTDAASTQAVLRDSAAQGQQVGAAFTQGAAQGVRQNQDQAGQAAADMTQRVIDESKKKAGIKSPSTVAAGIGSDYAAGLVGGLGSGVAAASNGVMGVASDRGLMVGYTWGRSMVTGADEVIQKSLFQAVSAPQIDSPQAKAWLGAQGLLGPAGAGASVAKAQAVTLGGSSTPRLNATINLSIDGKQVRVIAQDVVDVSMDNLADAISLQRG
jgi:hypothetical protein